MKTRSSERSYHSESTWRELIDEWSRSGLGQREFCHRHGVGYSTFGKWKKRILSSGDRLEPEFIEMKLPPGSAAGWDVELELGEGVILRVRRS